MDMAGFKVLEVKQLSPFPAEGILKEIPVEEYMTPRWSLTVERINQNIKLLNSLLFGFQDYCIIAEV